MAIKRMFSLDIAGTDDFCDMPATSQSLYFHLGLRADDDGFISNPKQIMKIVNCSTDDLKILIGKGYVIPFDSGIVVITDWFINNNKIRPDRYKPTRYTKELDKLSVDNSRYVICDGLEVSGKQVVDKRYPNGKQMVDKRYPQNRVDKNRIDKNNVNNKKLFYSENEELNKAIVSFIDFRKKMKAPMTEHAINLLVNKLKKLSSDHNEQIEILEQSIVNGWKGVFPLKKHEQQKGDDRPTYGEEYESADFYTLEFYERFKTDK